MAIDITFDSYLPWPWFDLQKEIKCYELVVVCNVDKKEQVSR